MVHTAEACQGVCLTAYRSHKAPTSRAVNTPQESVLCSSSLKSAGSSPASSREAPAGDAPPEAASAVSGLSLCARQAVLLPRREPLTAACAACTSACMGARS